MVATAYMDEGRADANFEWMMARRRQDHRHRNAKKELLAKNW